jgi:small subunit ribosomal protein S21
MQVDLRKDEYGEKLIRRFIKKVKRCGVLEDFRDKQYYLKPSVKERLKRKKAKQQRQRDRRKLEKRRNRSGK